MQNKKLEENIANCQKEILELHEHISSMKESYTKEIYSYKDLTNFNTKHSNSNSLIESLEDDKHKLKLDNDILKNKLNILSNDLNIFKASKNECIYKLKELEKDNSMLNKNIKYYNNITSKLNSELEALNVQNENLKHEITVLKSSNVALQSSLDQSRTKNYREAETNYNDFTLKNLLDIDNHEEQKRMSKIKKRNSVESRLSKSNTNNCKSLLLLNEDDDFLNNSNPSKQSNKEPLTLTANDIVNKMSKNLLINRSFSNSSISPKHTYRRSFVSNIDPFNYDCEEIGCENYRKFFFITFEALKINWETLEPFMVLSPENLYNTCKLMKIPFYQVYFAFFIIVF